LGGLLKTRAHLAIIVTIVCTGILIANANNAFAETLEWKSEFLAGILPTEPSEFDVNLKVSTFSNNELKLDWNEPDVSNNLVAVGYKILRKTIDAEYNILVENTYSTETSYIDGELSKNYYGYKIIPITERKKPEPISMHGIDRNNALFNIYKQGQELLAKQVLEQICPSCFDKEFAEIYDIVSSDLPKRINKLSDPEIQNKMLQESKVAENTLRQIFDSLYGHNQY